MIHLQSPETNASFCGNFATYDILTNETPPNREVSRLCKECKVLYDKHLDDESKQQRDYWNNRTPRKKFHDWLVGLSRVGESDMAIILDLMLIVGTFGLILVAKRIAVWLLKVGV